MSKINTWENTAAGNDHTPVPDFMPEGGTPIAAVNNWGREAQAAIRLFYEGIEWRNFLNDTEVLALVSTTSFDVPARVQALYTADTRVKITDSGLAGGFGYGAIVSRVGQLLTVIMDTAEALTAGLSMVEVGLSAEGSPISVTSISGGMALAPPVILNSVAVLDVDGQVVSSEAPIAASGFGFDADDKLVRSQDIDAGLTTVLLAATEIASYDRAAPGYIEFEVAAGLGIAAQWGQSPGDNDRTVTFPVPFSDTPYSMALTHYGVGARADTGAHVESLSAASADIDSGGSQDGVYWIAIGPTTPVIPGPPTMPLIETYDFVRSFDGGWNQTSSIMFARAGDVTYPEGTMMFMSAAVNLRTRNYILPTPWELTPAPVYTNSFASPPGLLQLACAAMSDDGTKVYFAGSPGKIVAYSLSTPYKINSSGIGMSLDGSFDISAAAGIASPDEISLSDDGSVMVVQAGSTLYEMDMPSAFDINAMEYNGVSAAYLGGSGAVVGPLGSNVYAYTEAASGVVSQYPMSTPWGVTTQGAVISTKNFGAQTTSARGIFVTADHMFIVDDDSVVYQYDAP